MLSLAHLILSSMSAQYFRLILCSLERLYHDLGDRSIYGHQPAWRSSFGSTPISGRGGRLYRYVNLRVQREGFPRTLRHDFTLKEWVSFISEPEWRGFG
jgi:hypothetical protein